MKEFVEAIMDFKKYPFPIQAFMIVLAIYGIIAFAGIVFAIGLILEMY